MADYDGLVVNNPTVYLGIPRQAGFRANGLVSVQESTSITTYYYRDVSNAFGNTTSAGTLATICAAGGVLLQTVTS